MGENSNKVGTSIGTCPNCFSILLNLLRFAWGGWWDLEDVAVRVPVELATCDARQARQPREIGLERDGSETVMISEPLLVPNTNQRVVRSGGMHLTVIDGSLKRSII
jgi:hypothetical protein